MKKLWIIGLLMLTGCGSPSKQTTTSSGGGNPPANVPNMTGTWSGTMTFTGLNGASLAWTITEDSQGNLTGQAGSSNLCDFSANVTGKIASSGQFYLQSADDTTFSVTGQANVTSGIASGNVGLGSDTGCGSSPQRLGTFTVALDPSN